MLEHKKSYEFETDKGSKVEVKIEAKIKELRDSDVEDILEEYRICANNFFLSLGKKIVGGNQ